MSITSFNIVNHSKIFLLVQSVERGIKFIHEWKMKKKMFFLRKILFLISLMNYLLNSQ